MRRRVVGPEWPSILDLTLESWKQESQSFVAFPGAAVVWAMAWSPSLDTGNQLR